MEHIHYSDLKNVYTFKADDDWGCYNENGKYIKGDRNNKGGYCRHNLYCNDGIQHHILEHRMKWEYFNGDIPDDKEIDHIVPISDGGTNKLSNLRVVTKSENQLNPFTRKKHSAFASTRVGDKNPFYGRKWNETQKKANKLTWKKVKQVLPNGEEKHYISAIEAARETGLSHSSIAYACRGRFGHIGHNYKGSEWHYE